MKNNKHLEDLNSVAKGLGEHLLAVTDEEILKEDKDEGIDTRISAALLRETMLSAVRKFRRGLLETTKDTLLTSPTNRARLSNSVYSATPQQRRDFLRSALQNQVSVTAQFREFEQMSDDDIVSALEDLEFLNSINSDTPQKDE